MTAAAYITVSMSYWCNCCVCGIAIYGPESLESHRREKKGTDFWCLNGHKQAFCGKTRAEIAEEAAAALRNQLDTERAKRELAERSVVAMRGQVTKIKNRVGNGVCPCCNRTFQNLMRHMQSKHPDFKDEK